MFPGKQKEGQKSFSLSFLVTFNYSIDILLVLYTNIDQTLVNSLHRLLNCEIGILDSHVITLNCCFITTEYRTRVRCKHM